MSANLRSWAYASLLTGGLLILVGGLAGGLMMGIFGGMMGSGMMGGAPGWMSSTWATAMAWWMGAVGVVTGSLVLYAAARVRAHPADSVAGTLAIVGGALSLLAMGGWVVGAILAIVGGALSLSAQAEANAAAR